MAKISTYPLEGNPKLSDKLIGTSVGLNQIGNLENPTYNFSLQQLLDLFSPLLPGNTLQGVLDNNNTATQDIILNGTIYTDGLEVSGIANIFSAYITDSIYIESELFDINNSQGTAGQILTSTGNGVEWITLPNTIPTLQQVLTSGNEADVDIILTANIIVEGINAEDALIKDSLQLDGTLIDSNGLTGTSGQMLISLGTGVEWQDVPVYTASSPLFINPATRNITIQQANGTQNGYLSFADWITFDGKQNALSGTGIVVSNGGIISYIANNSTNWNQAYNDTILSAAVTGTTTKTLTLTQRDGDTITASWTEGGGGGGISSIGLTMPAAFTVTNSPLTSNGVIAVTAAGDASQYIKGDGTLGTLPSTSTFVPYTGATANVNLGIYNITANSIIKNGGTSSQFLKADGSVDSTTYFPTPTGTISQYVRGDGSLATLPSVTGFVPYTGATADVDLGTYNLIADHIALNVSPSGAGFVVGATQWNNTLGSSQTLLKGGNVALKNGVDLVARVVNKVTPNTTLTKAQYQAVRVSGASGQKLAVNLAKADVDANSADTLGLVTETIPTNQEGFIITVGQLEDINTTGSLQGETWSDGDVLYLSPTTFGALTNIKPNGSTGHIVVIGYVEYAHSSQGKIYVKIMNGWELDELHNVYINPATLANKDLLQYNSSNQLWENKSLSAAGIQPTLPTFTNGSVLFSDGTTIAQDNSNFFWDDTNKRLGLGTTTPSAKLHVDGSMFLLDSATGVSTITFPNGPQIEANGPGGYFKSGLVHSSLFGPTAGNVGIGTTSPSAKLDVSGVIRGVLPDPSGVGGITAKLLSYSPSPYGLVFRGYSSGAHSIQVKRESNDVEFFPLILQPNGSNVGIGTVIPSALLDVNGDALINGITVGRGAGNDASNTVIGKDAFFNNLSGQQNTVVGYSAGGNLTSGDSNVFVGQSAGININSGSGNTIIGTLNSFPPTGAPADFSDTLSISKGASNYGTFLPHIWAPAVISTSSTATIISAAAGSYRAMFVEYVIEDESGNIRGGYIKGIWNNDLSVIKMTEDTTSSIGVTSDYVFDIVDGGGSNAALQITSLSTDNVYCSVTSRLLTRPY